MRQHSIIISIIIVILILAAAVFCLYHFGRQKPVESTDKQVIPSSESESAETAAIKTASSVIFIASSEDSEPAEKQKATKESSSESTKDPTAETAKEPSSEPTKSPASEAAKNSSSEPTKKPSPTPTKEPAETIGDLEEVPAGTLVEEDRIDRTNLEQYFKSYEISDIVFDRIYGDNRSYKTYCTVPREDLRYIKVLYRGFDNCTYVGELMVNTLLADDITDIFSELYRNDYPIEQMLLVDEYDADDDLSIAHNNTSAFNFRPVTGGTTPSNHAYGCAIDINPKNNPYFEYDANGNMLWYDEDVELYLDREAPDAYERHMINHDDLCFKLFAEHGWDWGGDWSNPVDYQHFEKPVYP